MPRSPRLTPACRAPLSISCTEVGFRRSNGAGHGRGWPVGSSTALSFARWPSGVRRRRPGDAVEISAAHFVDAVLDAGCGTLYLVATWSTNAIPIDDGHVSPCSSRLAFGSVRRFASPRRIDMDQRYEGIGPVTLGENECLVAVPVGHLPSVKLTPELRSPIAAALKSKPYENRIVPPG